jgi:hypothetical protein
MPLLPGALSAGNAQMRSGRLAERSRVDDEAPVRAFDVMMEGEA